jgi:translation initiation factor 2 beta subunit (eIF-2beta)/eIF-5
VVSGYNEKTTNGSKNKNSEIVINGMRSRKNIPTAIKILDGFE